MLDGTMSPYSVIAGDVGGDPCDERRHVYHRRELTNASEELIAGMEPSGR